jgi:uncharacterized membrane protein (UPF0127 family)
LTEKSGVVRLIHVQTGREIARLEIARTPFQRMRGLLGRSGLPAGEGMLIERCSSIHTFFMKFALDVIFVDSDWEVRRVVRGLQPWRLANSFGASRVVELAAGALDGTDLTSGDEIEIKEIP